MIRRKRKPHSHANGGSRVGQREIYVSPIDLISRAGSAHKLKISIRNDKIRTVSILYE
jgi:hypothetical protein